MSAVGSPTRDELRQAYADAWRKHLAGSPLTPLESLITEVIGLHPEYQPVVQDPKSILELESAVAPTVDNPFLHMGLHLAVREQLSIDRPPGVRDLQRQLEVRYGDLHRAEHVLMESLAEVLWEAQRAGVSPDELRYLALARRRVLG